MTLGMAKFAEFFNDDNGVGSMYRLTTFGAFIVASAIMLWLQARQQMTQDYFEAYLWTFATTGMVSKMIDARTFGNRAPAAQDGVKQ
ncbi:hypothetical protein R5W24_000460 [Gemmata sp. JC717]|uniref:hypothetical protein n=1 Tax=Gemmata algarum TaxID=2975278 RepID=UPI0021BB40EE|nr:hypothetical protein [Gemmata algarum]MDY3551384.1 hypothetical protein [Gemmata algarum]